jgi:hypothetical protein
MFYVGQEVICIDDSGFKDVGLPNPPKVNCVYTISEIAKGFDGTRIADGLCFAELFNPNPFNGLNDCFVPERFRPIQKKQTDISIFTALLNPANHKQLENT